MNYNIIVWRVKAEQKKCLFFLKRSLFFPDEEKKPVFYKNKPIKHRKLLMKSKIIEPSNTTGNQKGGLRNEKKSKQFYYVGSPYIFMTWLRWTCKCACRNRYECLTEIKNFCTLCRSGETDSGLCNQQSSGEIPKCNVRN